MVTVEGVARRIDPGSDIWAAADPVVRRWILRELSPATRVRGLVKDARAVVGALARAAEREAAGANAAAPASPPAAAAAEPAEAQPIAPPFAFLMGVLTAAVFFSIAALWPLFQSALGRLLSLVGR
jgi:ubiquinone biosynthesis protein